MNGWMQTVYLICAAAGGTILVVQTILIATGAGGADGDVDAGDLHHGGFAGDGHDGHVHGHGDDAHAGDSFLKLLSFKTLVAFVTFFGLGGLASAGGGLGHAPSLLIAVAAGGLALYAVAYLMAVMSRLQSKGNLDLRHAVGETGRVYLRVPAERSGLGKVTVAVQGRKVECKAVTAGPDIPTGADVRIVGVSAADTLEVALPGKD
jgi:hypothetical protein